MLCSHDVSGWRVTFNVNCEAGGETGTNIVEGGAKELPGIVSAHLYSIIDNLININQLNLYPGVGAVHTRLPYLDPGDTSGGGTVRHQTLHLQQRVLARVLQ